jgi:hypothetical protein
LLNKRAKEAKIDFEIFGNSLSNRGLAQRFLAL